MVTQAMEIFIHRANLVVFCRVSYKDVMLSFVWVFS